MKVLLVSSEDKASKNIRDRLLEGADWEEIGLFNDHPVRRSGDLLLFEKEGLHLYFEDVDIELSSFIKNELGMVPSRKPSQPLDLLIFLSKHRSEMDIRSLTVHPPGNYLSADYGGTSEYLPPSAPVEMTSTLRSLYQEKKALGLKDRTTYEVTHHGPRLSSPSFFIEIGSDETRWDVPVLGTAIARALLNQNDTDLDSSIPIAIGMGGGHYAPRFTDRAMRGKFAFGHMLPDYILRRTTSIEKCIELALDSTPDADHAFLHRSRENEDIISQVETFLDEKDIKIVD
jgi:D-aminoacyl-tRNA deacylase